MSAPSGRGPRLYSYVVKYDTGFAPNPFHGYCTLACCKPGIRKGAEKGDYIVGLAPKASFYKVVYVMQVAEKMGFNEYWNDPRFHDKRPVEAGGKMAEGDNIYHQDHNCPWIQEESRHSEKDSEKNKSTDLSGKYVLISKEEDFIYWGGAGPSLPPELDDLKVGIGYKYKSNGKLIPAFKRWYQKRMQKQKGKVGDPRDMSPQLRRSTGC